MAEGSDRTTYLWVAETILREHRRPLNARQIVSFGLERGLFDDRALSQTPQKSMQARLSMDIVNRGERSHFLRVAAGRFYLRDMLSINPEKGESSLEYKAPRRAPSPSQENVLVISRKHYEKYLNFQGLNLDFREVLSGILLDQSPCYLPRAEAELNPDYKQFVTYTIIQRRNTILSFRRGRYNRAASFLRGAQCVGFGGHVTAEDLTLFTLDDYGLRANAAREISEEIRFKVGRPKLDPSDIEIVGIINDDSSDVGVRHVGIVLRYWAPDTSEWDMPVRGEASVAQLQWIKAGAERSDLLQFEYWSQLVLRGLYPDFIASHPTFRIVRRAPFLEPHMLCVCGSIGSGKSITTRILCDKHGYRQVNTGKVLAKLLGIPAVPDTPRSEFQIEAVSFITTSDGPARLASAISDAALALGGGRVIVDGIRQLKTLEALRVLTDRRIAMVYVHTPPDVAYKMYVLRENQNSNLTLGGFMEIYNAPVENEVRYMISEADVVIYNWIGLDEYELVIEKAFMDLGLGN